MMPRQTIVFEVIGVDDCQWCPGCALPCAAIVHFARNINSGASIVMSSYFHCPECHRHHLVAA